MKKLPKKLPTKLPKKLLILLLVFPVAGCDSREDLALDGVDPPVVSSLGATTLHLHGKNFTAGVRYSVDDHQTAVVDNVFTVAMGSLDLGTVIWIDAQNLDATVPAGMAPGIYDVTVHGPLGTGTAVAALTVQKPPALTATASIPATTSVGQTFDFVLTVRNDGDATALQVTPDVPTLSGAGMATPITIPVAVDIAGGTQHDFHWSYSADGAGTLTFTAGATGDDSSDTQIVATPVSATTELDTAPVLTASAGITPSTVSLGQSFSVTLSVANFGQTTAASVTPSTPVPSGTATAQLLTSPVPISIVGGGNAAFTWTYRATGPGNLSFGLSATGTGPAGDISTPPISAGPLTVDQGPLLTGAMVVTPALLSAGQALTVTLVIANSGGVTAAGVSPSTPSQAGAGGASISSIPVAAGIPAGGSATFVWTYTSSVAGDLTLSATATGTDLNSGMPATMPQVTSNTIHIQSPTALAVTVAANPALVSVGQQILVDVNVTNSGDADASAVTTTTPSLSGSGAATLVLGPPAQAIPGHQARTFSYTYKATTVGSVTFRSHASGTAGNTNATVTTATVTSTAVVIQTPPSLSGSISITPTLVILGQPVTVALTITNTGQATARGVQPYVVGGSSAGVLISGPTPPIVNLASGASQTFVWKYIVIASGNLSGSAAASGFDANSGAVVTSPTYSQGLVSVAPELVGVLTVPSSVPAATNFNVTMTVTCNTDECRNIVPSALTQNGTTTATLLSGPTPASVNGPLDMGDTATFTWVYRAVGPGTLSFSGTASARDKLNLTTFTGTINSSTMTVGNPSNLTATLDVPLVLNRGGLFTVTLTVTNSGGAAVTGLMPSALATTLPATLLSGPTPGSATVAAGAVATFTWTYQATQNGALQMSGSATGIDVAAAQPTSVSYTSKTAAVSDTTLLFTNPFGDGTSFLDVFGYDNLVYFGPRKNGSGAMRSNPDGSTPQAVSFGFYDDNTGHPSANKAASPFPSIGAAGCTPNSSGCGPDNEDGRGLFNTGVIAGTPWLLVAGSKSTGTSYAYMTSDSSTTPLIPYVDLQSSSAGSPFGVTANHVFHDRVYFGLGAVDGPNLIRLDTTPTAPGLDATSANTTDLKSSKSALGAKSAIVDVITDFADRLYIANAQGCLASTTNAPRPFDSNPRDWTSCTPQTDPLATTPTTKTASIAPADRSYPGAVVFGGRLYLGRNTVSGPQLFACDPTSSGDHAVCDPADWILVGRNSQGNAALSQFNDTGNTALSLLVATADYLYVGFDNTTGIQVYRSTIGVPSVRGDFEGAGGCSAAQHPSNCAALGTSGLGDSANTRIWSATVATFAGRDNLYLTAGNPSVGGRVFRIAE